MESIEKSPYTAARSGETSSEEEIGSFRDTDSARAGPDTDSGMSDVSTDTAPAKSSNG